MGAAARESLADVARAIAGTSYSVTGGVDLTKVPPVPSVSDVLPTYKGGEEVLAFCMWQIRLSTDREVIVRALASACAALIRDPSNLTGSKAPVTVLTGYAAVGVANADLTSTAATNFVDASDITLQQWVDAVGIDIMEKAFYFGVLCHAMCKTPQSGDAMKAFNENRAGAATQANIGDPQIFVPNSPWLSYETVRKVHASFNAYSACRVHLIRGVIGKFGSCTSGDSKMFADAFSLLADFGVTNLAIIKDAIIRYPSIVNMPGIEQEVRSALAGLRAISAITDEPIRPFVKAMYMNRLVFVKPGDIANLLGICKEYLKPTHESYKRYKGGFVTPEQLRWIAADLGADLVPDEADAPAPPAVGGA